ncbi:MAG: Clp protease [Lachnospiraceae bacterium]|nr:Clp protease [Lachnospiraceae bacterium]
MSERENEKNRKDDIEENGQVELTMKDGSKIYVLTIIGEIEGHEVLSGNCKTTKYEHILPRLAELEEDNEISGILILINTVGGDVEAGLAIAEMISSLSKPTVSLVLGGSHSIGVPIAVSTDYSYIVPTGNMVVHPVRINGLIIGAPQTYEYFKLLQDRIVGYVTSHSKISKERIETLMMNTGMFTKDLGTILVGEDTVKEGIIDAVGGMKEARNKLLEMIKAENIKK